ncbi:FUSC family protein [Thioclava sp. GXIMD4215]|uniref:FUSC family protein n=1 Tax=Thioclava sp. GXIMD4215 TaxID=3131928 RepID=UPI00311AC4A6
MASPLFTGPENGRPPSPAAHRSLIYRMARRLEGYSIGMVPEFIGVAEGLRASLAFAVMVLTAAASGEPKLLWAAFAAFWVCLCDPGGRDRTRIRAMGAFVAAGTLAAFLGAASAGLGPLYASLTLIPLIFLPALGGIFGPSGAQSGTLICVVGGVAVGFPNDPVASLHLAGAFLVGGIWALVFSFWIWKLRSQGPARRAIASVFTRLAEMNSAMAARLGREEILGAAEPEYRRALRAAIERARGTILGLGNGHTQFMAELGSADRIFASMIALDHMLSDPLSPEEEAPLREQLARIGALLSEAQMQSMTRHPHPERLVWEAEDLARAADRAGARSQAVVRNLAEAFLRFAEHLRGDSLSGSAPQQDGTPRPSWRQIPDATLRHALRLTVAVVVTYLVCVALEMKYFYWATMATIVVLQPALSTTWPRMLERVLGSITGGLFAAGLLALSPGQLPLLAVIIPTSAITIAFKRVNYTIFTIGVSALFVLVTELVMPNHGIALSRALDNILGSVIAFVVGATLWPGRAEPHFRDILAQAVQANMDYAAAAVGSTSLPEPVDALRRQAGLESTNAETIRQRKLMEGRRGADQLDAAGDVLGALRVLAGAVTTHALISPEADPEKEHLLRQTAQSFADAIRHAGDASLPALPAQTSPTDLRKALELLQNRLDLYLKA